MRANKIPAAAAFIIFAGALAGTYFVSGPKTAHLPFHAAIAAVILLSLSFSARDVVILTMLFSSVAWIFGFIEIISDINMLLAETAVIVLSAAVLGWYEVNVRNEAEKQQTIIDYKKEEVSEIKKTIEKIKKENEKVLEEIKKSRKKFI